MSDRVVDASVFAAAFFAKAHAAEARDLLKGGGERCAIDSQMAAWTNEAI
ncbi:MAG: hypothetical protein ACYDC3_07065 [Candidatus Binataceae bacterium]